MILFLKKLFQTKEIYPDEYQHFTVDITKNLRTIKKQLPSGNTISDKGSLVGYITEINEDYIGFRHYTRFGNQMELFFIKVKILKMLTLMMIIKVMECLIQYSDILTSHPTLLFT
jgi:hypothetical protein